MFLLWQFKKQGDIQRGHQSILSHTFCVKFHPTNFPTTGLTNGGSLYKQPLEWICHDLQPSSQTRLQNATQVKLVRYSFNCVQILCRDSMIKGHLLSVLGLAATGYSRIAQSSMSVTGPTIQDPPFHPKMDTISYMAC